MSDNPPPGYGRETMKDSVRRYLENRSPFSGMTRSELEQFITEFLRGDSKNRERVEDLIEEVRARSRRGVDRITDLVRTEVKKEFDTFSPSRREEIGEFFERLVGLVGEYFGPGRRDHAIKTTRTAAKSAEKAAKKTVKKAASATKAAAKKTVAKKKVAKRAPAKRAAAKKSPAPPKSS
jgi:hypothetical protein